MPKVALITGITGQDGSYLAELLLGYGYVVHGIVRRSSSFNTDRIDHLLEDKHDDAKLYLHYGDLTDHGSLLAVLNNTEPDEVYNLGAQSHVRVSFEIPIYTAETVAIGTLNLLEAIRDYRNRTKKEIRYYQASSSELFGRAPAPQSERTPFRPCSPYACAKLDAYWNVVNYREGYGLFACNGILFNHESPRRGETFVTRKITRAATRIKLGLQDKLYLGNLNARRDWGYAKEYVFAMWQMLQLDEPEDFVIATGRCCTVEDWLVAAFASLGMSWREHVEIDERYIRPVEVNELRGDVGKALAQLAWHASTDMGGLCKLMVEADLRLAEREKALATVAA